jgi:hypothetical protein
MGQVQSSHASHTGQGRDTFKLFGCCLVRPWAAIALDGALSICTSAAALDRVVCHQHVHLPQQQCRRGCALVRSIETHSIGLSMISPLLAVCLHAAGPVSQRTGSSSSTCSMQGSSAVRCSSPPASHARCQAHQRPWPAAGSSSCERCSSSRQWCCSALRLSKQHACYSIPFMGQGAELQQAHKCGAVCAAALQSSSLQAAPGLVSRYGPGRCSCSSISTS